MREPDTILSIHRDRGSRKLSLERVYRHLFNPAFYLRAYGKIYRNSGAMTKGTTEETVDSMSERKIQEIIDLLRQERFRWSPVRRTEIPKPKGGTRPLGLPTWSDKLVQEVLRTLLEAYYEPRFSERSHGFRPGRSCHTALHEIHQTWSGTIWFIEGDISKCFDSFDHLKLLEILRRDIHDGRLIRLIEGLLKSGYMEDWRWFPTLSGSPQGGILSPLLSNVYLNELDQFVEDTLIPEYTQGDRRRKDEEYNRIMCRIAYWRKKGNWQRAKSLVQQRRRLPCRDPFDPDYRRLRYVRYADDFLLGFAGPKREAEDIRDRLKEYLKRDLKLKLSVSKTLITHAVKEKARFLGYQLKVNRDQQKRSVNGSVALLMPHQVISRVKCRFSHGGRVVHRADWMADNDYTIIHRFQSVLRGIYNYYSMAHGVSRRMCHIQWILEQSLVKTLARKYRVKCSRIYGRYLTRNEEGKRVIRAVIQRPDRKPLVAEFSGLSFARVQKPIFVSDFRFEQSWSLFANERSEVVQRLLVRQCELCGAKSEMQVHHIRKLSDIDRPGRRPKAKWEKIMAARRRKTLVVCGDCHKAIHQGSYDGPSVRRLPESRML